MKYEGKRPSGSDGDIDVYTFTMGKQEAKLIHETLDHFVRETRQIFTIQPHRRRAKNIMREIAKNVLKT